ncbi:MAG: TIM-barrel domain-containing protein, partial [Acidobacteriota bacterium]
LDWNYWPSDSWGSHDFDKERFPDPKGMVEAVHDLNAQIMVSVWPKFYPTTENYQELEEAGFIYRRNIDLGTRDWIGPGYPSSFYDPYTREAREIFWRQMEEKLDVLGFDAWWMDATEPDVHSNLSYEERKLRAGPTALGSGSRYFNSYALANAQSVYEGERAGKDPNKRVFILTRSGFPGIQRYSATVWSGDIVSRWDDLKAQISAGTNISLAGMPNWTFDIGGFSVEDRYVSRDPDHVEEWRELNARWFQFGAFAPIFRSHGQDPPREIFNISEPGSEVYKSMVKYTKLRYRLLPYIYSVASEMQTDFGALMRGLPMDFPSDPEARTVGEQYMFGPYILVSPIYEFKARTRDLYLPEGHRWYDFHSGKSYEGGQWIQADAPLSEIPLFIRAGAVLPLGPDVQYHDEDPAGEVTVVVYPGEDGSFSLYEDDGETYDYTQGAWSRIALTWDETLQTLTIGTIEGSYRVAETRSFLVKWADTPGASVRVRYSGTELAIERP